MDNRHKVGYSLSVFILREVINIHMYKKETNKLVQEYLEFKDLYDDFGEIVSSLLKSFLTSSGIPYYTIEYRSKNVDSLREKIQRKRVLGKHYSKLDDITDLVGVRVILFFSDDVPRVRDIIKHEFADTPQQIKYETESNKRKKNVGYEAEHQLVQLSARRAQLNEYKRFNGLICEIQIKSVLQHAWAEIEHDIGYKPKLKENDLERSEIRKLFKKNAQLLKKVDEQFVTIREKHVDLLTEYAAKVSRHKLKALPINYDTVRAYLKKKLNVQRIPRNSVIKAVETARVNKLKNIYELEEYIDNTDYVYHI